MTAAVEKKTKPILGVIWGVFLGVGMALWAINLKIIDLDVGAAAVVVVLGIVLGVVWSLFGPAKKPKGTPPAERVPVVPSAPAAPPDPVETAEEPGEPTAAEAPEPPGASTDDARAEQAAPPTHPPRRTPLQSPGHDD